MKSYLQFRLACLIAVVAGSVHSAPPTKDVKKVDFKKSITASEPVIPQSVFAMPATPKDGRDPFFPASTRPYYGTTKAPVSPNKPQVIELPLVLTGIIPNKLAMVCGRTFSEGEEGEIVVSGTRKKIRCLKVKDESAVIELLPEGERRELKMRFGAN